MFSTTTSSSSVDQPCSHVYHVGKGCNYRLSSLSGLVEVTGHPGSRTVAVLGILFDRLQLSLLNQASNTVIAALEVGVLRYNFTFPSTKTQ